MLPEGNPAREDAALARAIASVEAGREGEARAVLEEMAADEEAILSEACSGFPLLADLLSPCRTCGHFLEQGLLMSVEEYVARKVNW